MEPTLHDGDQVLVEIVHKAGPPPIGSIILTRAERRGPQAAASPSAPQPLLLVLHRLMAVEEGGAVLVTRGDGLPYRDAPWRGEQWVGVLRGVLRGGRWLEPRAGHRRCVVAVEGVRPERLRRLLLSLLGAFAWHPAADTKMLESACTSALRERSLMADERFEFQELGNELAVFDRRTGSVHVLNTLAAEIWRKSAGGAGLNEILRDFQTAFPDVTLDRLQQDILNTLSSLAEAGLLPEHP